MSTIRPILSAIKTSSYNLAKFSGSSVRSIWLFKFHPTDSLLKIDGTLVSLKISVLDFR